MITTNYSRRNSLPGAGDYVCTERAETCRSKVLAYGKRELNCPPSRVFM